MHKIDAGGGDENDSLSEEEWDRIVELLKDPATADPIGKKLRHFVIRQLRAKDGERKLRSLERRLSIEDMAQSAFGSILRAAGTYEDRRGDELRAIFAAIVTNKQKDKHARHRRDCRDIRQEEFADETEMEAGVRPQPSDKRQRIRPKKSDSSAAGAETAKPKEPIPQIDDQENSFEEWILNASQGASPEDGLVFEEIVQQVSSEYRDVLKFTLDGFSIDEIAARLGCCRRTVSRRQGMLRKELKRILGYDPNAPPPPRGDGD